jgi:hypothetical protein
MKQRLLDYNGDTITRRQARARENRYTRNDPITQERRTAKQIITKARKNVLGKAIKTFTPSNTQLTDQQKQEYVPIFLPDGAIGRRRITESEITTAAADLPAGSTLKDIKNFLYEKHT